MPITLTEEYSRALAALEGAEFQAEVTARLAVLPPSSVATPCLNASVSWPACVGERH